MGTRNFIKTLCKQKLKTFFISTFNALNIKWVPRLKILSLLLHPMLIFRSVNSLNKLIELGEMFLYTELTEILKTRLYQLHVLLKGRGYMIFLNVLF